MPSQYFTRHHVIVADDSKAVIRRRECTTPDCDETHVVVAAEITNTIADRMSAVDRAML